MYEVLKPNYLDQRQAMENQFVGMTSEEFTYEDFEEIRFQLVKLVNQSLNLEDKNFLLSIENLIPDWEVHH